MGNLFPNIQSLTGGGGLSMSDRATSSQTFGANHIVNGGQINSNHLLIGFGLIALAIYFKR